MNPARKRKTRLVVALGAAILLSVALIYTSFAAATEAKQPSELLDDGIEGVSYTLTGQVVPGSIKKQDKGITFKISDRDGTSPILATYQGAIPDPFRGGREVILTGKLQGGTFVGEIDTLITKCPSKFKEGEYDWIGPDGKEMPDP